MHLNLTTITIGAALVGSLYLFFQTSDRMFPTVASIVAAIELLLVSGIMSLSLSKFRIDVILPAVLAIAGVACWGKSSSKGQVTAATTVALVGVTQLLLALHLFR